MAKTNSPTRTVVPCRISFANIWEPKSVNGSDPKYSVSCLVSKDDKETLLKINACIEAAKEDAKTKKWGGKIPANLKLPIHDGDIERPDDEAYHNMFFFNANSKDAPQIVDRRKQTITDSMMVYSGCYCNVSINMYGFSVGGNRGIAVGLGNIQFVKDGEQFAGRTSADADFDELDEDESGFASVSDEDLPDWMK